MKITLLRIGLYGLLDSSNWVLRQKVKKKTRVMDQKKFGDIFIRFDTIPACDGRTDRQTRFDGKDRAMQGVARVKLTT